MRSLQYYFYEFISNNQIILHQFDTDRVKAFATHRLLERQGKKLSAVQIRKLSVKTAASVA
jgi:hypothetical protein